MYNMTTEPIRKQGSQGQKRGWKEENGHLRTVWQDEKAEKMK